MTIYTVGYENRSVKKFLEVLVSTGIQIVIDVRANPFSKKRGFCKKNLKETLESASIRYIWARDYGVPPREQETGTKEQILSAYRQRVRKRFLLKWLSQFFEEKPTALMCVEASAEQCHRGVLAEELSEFMGAEIVHL